jgi:hypothetical protein
VAALEHETRLWHDDRVETRGAASTSAGLQTRSITRLIARRRPIDAIRLLSSNDLRL